MAHYIDKSALVAEIERRIKKFREQKDYDSIVKTNTYKGLLYSFINTLEVKEVEESTATDRGMAEKIIINLKRVEQDYHIDLTKEMEWIRSKSRKGE